MDKHDAFQRIERGDLAGLKEALEGDVAAAAQDGQGFSLLYAAAAKGRADMVQALIDAGAEVNKTNDAGDSPLMVAAARGHLEVVEALLAAGADAANKNRWGLDARDWAKWAGNANEIIARLRV